MARKGEEIMRLQATAVPISAVKIIAAKLKDAGIPLTPTAIVMYSIAKAADIPDNEIIEFTMPRRGRRYVDALRELESA